MYIGLLKHGGIPVTFFRILFTINQIKKHVGSTILINIKFSFYSIIYLKIPFLWASAAGMGMSFVIIIEVNTNSHFLSVKH